MEGGVWGGRVVQEAEVAKVARNKDRQRMVLRVVSVVGVEGG